MKRSLLISFLLILFIGTFSGLFAEITVELGNGEAANVITGHPSPYGTWAKAFRQQFLIHAAELNDLGAGIGDISSLAFNVSALNNVGTMDNFRIRFKHTSQTFLTTIFEDGNYIQVFQEDEFTPVEGWNTHNFSTPFVWDGASNILVDIVTDVIDGDNGQNSSVFYSSTDFSSSLRFHSNTENGDSATSGMANNNRSNMKLSMTALDLLDVAAVSIIGSQTPSKNSASSYTVKVRNFSPDTIDDYSVKLMLGDTEITSLPGVSLESMEYEDFVFEWTPAQTGPAVLYGKVFMISDENPLNDITPGYEVLVMDEGLNVIQIGSGDAVNTQTAFTYPHFLNRVLSSAVLPPISHRI